MDHAGVFQPASFMAPDALVGAIQALAFMLALLSSFRVVLRIAHTTDLVVHRVTMLAMLFCSVFAWLTFGYLFFRHELETCIVRVVGDLALESSRAHADALFVCLALACSTLRAGPAWSSTSSARPSSTPSS